MIGVARRRSYGAGTFWGPQDTLVGASGGLPGRVSTDGNTWTTVSTYSGHATIASGPPPGIISSAAGFGLQTLGSTAPSANYRVEGDLKVVNNTDGGILGLAVRVNSTTGEMYALIYDPFISTSTPFALYYLSDGAATTARQLALKTGAPTNGHDYHWKLTVSGTGSTVTLTVLITDNAGGGTFWSTSVGDTNASRIVTAGKVGIWSYGQTYGNGINNSFVRAENFFAGL